MISLMYPQSRLTMVTIVFYTCILLPLLELKKALLRIILPFLPLSRYYYHENGDEGGYKVGSAECSSWQPEVTVAYHTVSDKEGEVLPEEETCSVCLVEFDREDDREILSRVDRCGHLFHKDCIDKWLDCNHFTCPLCRSFLLVKS